MAEKRDYQKKGKPPGRKPPKKPLTEKDVVKIVSLFETGISVVPSEKREKVKQRIAAEQGVELRQLEEISRRVKQRIADALRKKRVIRDIDPLGFMRKNRISLALMENAITHGIKAIQAADKKHRDKESKTRDALDMQFLEAVREKLRLQRRISANPSFLKGLEEEIIKIREAKRERTADRAALQKAHSKVAETVKKIDVLFKNDLLEEPTHLESCGREAQQTWERLWKLLSE